MIHKREKGNKGEDIACTFLEKNGFTVADRNYYKKWGELDIIAKKGKELHFFEVKSVMKKYKSLSLNNSHRPEENVTPFKVKQLRKIIQTYLTDKKYGLDAKFTFHILSVFMDEKARTAHVEWMKNVIL